MKTVSVEWKKLGCGGGALSLGSLARVVLPKI